MVTVHYFISNILKELATMASAESRQEVNLIVDLRAKSDMLQVYLHSTEVEGKQMNEVNGFWILLDELKEVCYETEDLLDEWNTVLLKLKIDERSSSLFKGKVCFPFIPPCCSSGRVTQRRDLALRVKNLNDRIRVDKITLRRNMASSESRRVVSSPCTELSKLHGRDEVKKDLLTKLLNDSSYEAVVGMAGVGKTALAQIIYNDNEIVALFDMRIWVCASPILDFRRVLEDMIIQLDQSLLRRYVDSYSLDDLLETVKKFIKGKKVFLVLDDVWTSGMNAEDLRKIIVVFRTAAGSRILVTSRKDIARLMDSFHIFHLEQLSQQDSWLILSQEAFIGRGEKECENLKDIGWKIAEKSKGLPLAAKTLGCLLRCKRTREEWENILHSEIWELDLVQKNVFAPFLLSYYDLPPAIQRCFLYCSIFPKDVKTEVDDLIRHWMAHGYLIPSRYQEMESKGAEFFSHLVQGSFFQDLEKLEDGTIHACKMHGIIFDFARYLMGNEFVFKNLHSEDNLRVVLASGKIFYRVLLTSQKLQQIGSSHHLSK